MYSDMAKISNYVMKMWPGLNPLGEHQAKVMELYKSGFKLSNMCQGIEMVPDYEIQWGE